MQRIHEKGSYCIKLHGSCTVQDIVSSAGSHNCKTQIYFPAIVILNYEHNLFFGCSLIFTLKVQILMKEI